MRYTSILYFAFFIIPHNFAMELPIQTLTPALSDQLQKLMAFEESKNIDHSLRIVNLHHIFHLQESYADLFDQYKEKQCTKKQLDEDLLKLAAQSLESFHRISQEHISSHFSPLLQFLQPFLDHRSTLLLHAKFTQDTVMDIPPHIWESENKKLVANYESKRATCKQILTQLINKINQDFPKTMLQDSKKQISSQKKQQASHFITKEETGYSADLPDLFFINFLHNCCMGLEAQNTAAEVIALHELAAKQYANILLIRNQFVQEAGIFENDTINEKDIDDDDDDEFKRASFSKFKTPSTIEGNYVLQILLEICSAATLDFEALKEFENILHNHPNHEVKNYARYAGIYAQEYSASLRFIRLGKIFYNIYEHRSIIFILANSYKKQLAAGNMQKSSQIYPIQLFEYYNATLDAADAFNESPSMQARANSTLPFIKIARTFIAEYENQKSNYCQIYKRLKDTLRETIRHAPGLNLSKEYLHGTSLLDYDLNAYIKKKTLTEIELTELKQARKDACRDAKLQRQTDNFLPESANYTPKKNALISFLDTNKRSRPNKAKTVTLKTSDNPIPKPDHHNLIDPVFGKFGKKIFDAKNNVIFYFFKLKSPDYTAESIMILDDRVRQWFEDPQKALEAKKFADNDPRKATSTLYHTFTPAIDKWTLKWGFKKQALNTHGKEVQEIMLPGLLEKDGIKKQILFGYVIDSKKLCYHRCIEEYKWNAKPFHEWKTTADLSNESK